METLLKFLTIMKHQWVSFYFHLTTSPVSIASFGIVLGTILFYVMICKFAYILLREEQDVLNKKI
jgi:hypothetical protein